MEDKVILYLCIEGNNNIGCGGSGGKNQPHQHRLLEEECELFLSRWYNKKLNNEFAKIETFLICPSNNPPTSKFVDEITTKYNKVHYIHCPHNIADTFPAGWFNTPLGGKWLEENIEFDKMIHLDLDMILLKEFNKDYLNLGNNIANCAVYDKEYRDDYDEINGIPKDFVTCFIISNKEGKFYNIWWEEQLRLQQHYESNFVLDIKKNEEIWWEYCNCEECAVDILYYNHKLKIGKIEDCQFGDSQGYGNMGYYTSKGVFSDIHFLHCHINENWKEEIKNYTKQVLCLQTMF